MRRTARFLFPTVVALALAACADAPTPVPAPDSPALSVQAGSTDVRDRWIVVFRDDVADPRALAARLVSEHRGTLHYAWEHAIRGFAATLPPGAAEALRRNPGVAYVEPDVVYTLEETQGSAPWGLDRIDQRSLPLSGTYTYQAKGEFVRAYVVDTGIRTTHNDFGGRASVGADVVGGTGADCHGHGTGVAGVLGGSTYGVAKRVQLVAVRVFTGCTTPAATASAVVTGLDWIRANHVKPAVVNMSLGSTSGSTAAVDQTVQALISEGVLVVAAAGNNNGDACLVSPGLNRTALTVGATGSGDGRWVASSTSGSNWGGCLDVFAPGANIVMPSIGSNTATATRTGTSFAAPHVAGAVAKYLEVNPAATPAQAHAYIVDNATAGVVTNAGSQSPNRLLWSDPALRRAVASVTVSPGAVSVQVGYGAQLTATVYDAQGRVITGRTVSWSSANTAVASVTSGGVVIGNAVGNTTVTATVEGVAAAPVAVEVTPAPPPPFTVGEIGVQQPAPAFGTCGHYVSVSGGTQPYFYAWYVNGVQQPTDESGGMLYTNDGSTYFVSVDVSDSAGNSGHSERWVEVAPNPGGMACLQ